MPLVDSTYSPPFLMRNGHVATVIPSVFRKITGIAYQRERIYTNDNDFLDLDWLKKGRDKLIIISHGLEGSANRPYVKGMSKFFFKNGWDALGWNCRSCSGEMNTQARFYHHGATEDLETVVNYAIKTYGYKTIVLVGFSMGGGLTLKYIGEREGNLQEQVKSGIAFSVPVSLASSVRELGLRKNDFYRKRFLRKLEAKIREKSTKFPDQIVYSNFNDIKQFPDFDNKYTAPLHGFLNADHFYEMASPSQYMYNTKVPLLIVNAVNDPFLGDECYPYEDCKNSEMVYLETPKYGGHVGFALNGEANYMEKRTLEFINQHVNINNS